MQLGDFFPASIREATTEQRLIPGAVLYLPMTFRDGRTKEKFLVVVAAIAPKLLVLVINSEINPFIADRPGLKRCQLVLPQDKHTFLTYDSYLACHEVFSVDAARIAADLSNDTSRYKGEISDEVKNKILGVIATRPTTISALHRDAITAALS
jgi:hypothetical protein